MKSIFKWRGGVTPSEGGGGGGATLSDRTWIRPWILGTHWVNKIFSSQQSYIS